MPLSDFVWSCLAIAGILYFGTCLCIYRWQRRLIFVPSKGLSETPSSYGLDYDEVWIREPPTGQDALHGWWLPVDGSCGVVLLLHGNSYTIGDNLSQAALFHRLGFSVLLADYRGYGLSEGPFPNEQRVYADAEAMWQYLTTRSGIAPESILVYGHSLGGAIAIDLAARHPDIGALVIESSFTSMRDMASQKPYLALFPTRLLLTQHFDSLRKVRSLAMPTLFIHGQSDGTVPYSMSQVLYQAAQDPKALLLSPNADHTDVADTMGSDYDHGILSIARSLSHLAT